MKTRLALIGLLLILVSVCFAQERKGYSIFNGTLVDLTWPEVKKIAEGDALVIVPVGVIEEHVPHLSLGTDTYLTYRSSLELKKSLEKRKIKTVITPPMYWGVMQLKETGAYPGSFTVNPATMKALLMDIFTDLQRWGFRKIYCQNMHGDRIHRQIVNEAVEEAAKKLNLQFFNEEKYEDDAKEPDLARYAKAKLYEPDYHGGAPETSMMLGFYPEEVNIEKAKKLKPENGFHPLGYAGDPASYGNIDMPGFFRAEIEMRADNIVRWIEELRKK